MSDSEQGSYSTKETSVAPSDNIKLVKRSVPFNTPINPIKPPSLELTADQTEKYNEVLAHFQNSLDKEFAIPDTNKTEKLVDLEKAWLTKECFLRYLNATKWKVDHAIKRIEETILWRRSFGLVPLSNHDVDIITPDMVEAENVTGKNLIIGYDNDNRPCLYLRNGYQNTKPSILQVKHLVFMLERVIQFMPPGQDKLALMTDFKSAPAELKLSSKLPSISISKQVLHILQHHYPERLGRGLFTNIPWIGYTFFKLVSPFIDPYTKSKTIYDQPFENFVPYEQLDKEFNGGIDFEYNHDEYWREMNRMGDRKWSNYLENFDKLGKSIGLSEYDLRLGYDQ
ncbi:phosphatidylinositol transfer protein Pdr16p [[Candida] jaroonii]|uniref:Phosphatidylinositol transfer protein Pdr16p n=1 Tax=[Candida] jaroonii TaxID=467808 RepID=A0ACA9YB98_9ASCO|nr:phosphatidylinositol transfer protein Pdr16p [[Candida] jaroonii]